MRTIIAGNPPYTTVVECKECGAKLEVVPKDCICVGDEGYVECNHCKEGICFKKDSVSAEFWERILPYMF